MFLDLIIFQELLKIFVFVIPINRNHKQKIRQNKITKNLSHLLKRPCI